MGSANNAVSALSAYLTQGTAATTVSTVNNLKQNVQATDKSFDKVFNKASENLGNTKTTDVKGNSGKTEGLLYRGERTRQREYERARGLVQRRVLLV